MNLRRDGARLSELDANEFFVSELGAEVRLNGRQFRTRTARGWLSFSWTLLASLKANLFCLALCVVHGHLLSMHISRQAEMPNNAAHTATCFEYFALLCSYVVA